MTDNEKPLRNAIRYVFPGTNTLICYWHIIKNIQARFRPRINVAVAAEQPARSWSSSILMVSQRRLSSSQSHKYELNRRWETIKMELDQIFFAHSQEEHDLRWREFRDEYETPYGEVLR
ncbi:uncharacterized protein N7515_007079 [Penicillium bovifimosum]|uniref:MULE transposase domain-containing protein n=1 Tax=Penicillium bovifimosum TaxID=126998 RepID=A0A9W9GVX7_9EURO|nr:uncharacterized protein N7515_007079 [Penicillium bovifimosum]KAJ5131040.1 hypothetical protein N7515_007079 [Penicillium bovifimosum]